MATVTVTEIITATVSEWPELVARIGRVVAENPGISIIPNVKKRTVTFTWTQTVPILQGG